MFVLIAEFLCGSGLDEDLHHYYDYDSEPKKTGPKRINLDDSKGDRKDKYVPPTSLTVHLSKIPIPELELKLKPKQDLKGKKKEEGKGVKARIFHAHRT